jgi:hypothetical protein
VPKAKLIRKPSGQPMKEMNAISDATGNNMIKSTPNPSEGKNRFSRVDIERAANCLFKLITTAPQTIKAKNVIMTIQVLPNINNKTNTNK